MPLASSAPRPTLVTDGSSTVPFTKIGELRTVSPSPGVLIDSVIDVAFTIVKLTSALSIVVVLEYPGTPVGIGVGVCVGVAVAVFVAVGVAVAVGVFVAVGVGDGNGV